MKNEEKQITNSNKGRSKISSMNRKSVSKRAIKGKIMIEKGELCPNCNNNKWIINMNENSEKFNHKKCSRCKKWLSK